MFRRTRRISIVSIRRSIVRIQRFVIRGQRSVVRGAFSSSPYDGPSYADNAPLYAAHFRRLHTTDHRPRTTNRCTRTMNRHTRRIFIVRGDGPSYAAYDWTEATPRSVTAAWEHYATTRSPNLFAPKELRHVARGWRCLPAPGKTVPRTP